MRSAQLRRKPWGWTLAGAPRGALAVPSPSVPGAVSQLLPWVQVSALPAPASVSPLRLWAYEQPIMLSAIT